jgi:hypothetical protein
MDYKILKWLFLFAAILVQVGCATTKESADDTTPDLEPSPSHDDSHGWGTNIQGGGH